jgi:CMP/dCMP kinase
MKQIKPFVITINRQLGSGGSYLGQQVDRELDISYADREIISEAAKQLLVLETELESREEKVLSFWKSFVQFNAFAPNVYTPPKTLLPTNRELFETEASIIKRIASERSSVIIGRCGFYILRNHPNKISIYLHSDFDFRKKRVASLYNVSEEEAGSMINQNDKDRSLYCKTFTGKEWVDARNYDLSLDTGKLGFDKCTEIILDYLKWV